MQKKMEKEQQARIRNAREWAKSLDDFDISDQLLRRRHHHPKYAIKELIREERRRKNK